MKTEAFLGKRIDLHSDFRRDVKAPVVLIHTRTMDVIFALCILRSYFGSYIGYGILARQSVAGRYSERDLEKGVLLFGTQSGIFPNEGLIREIFIVGMVGYKTTYRKIGCLIMPHLEMSSPSADLIYKVTADYSVGLPVYIKIRGFPE